MYPGVFRFQIKQLVNITFFRRLQRLESVLKIFIFCFIWSFCLVLLLQILGLVSQSSLEVFVFFKPGSVKGLRFAIVLQTRILFIRCFLGFWTRLYRGCMYM